MISNKMTNPLIAYHGKAENKEAIIAQLIKHRDADQLIKGRYWENGKGCAVGCTIHGSDHFLYEKRFGIPEQLARLEDMIFEILPNRLAQNWPIRFMKAIRPGADLSRVNFAFMDWVLGNRKINVEGHLEPMRSRTVMIRGRLKIAMETGAYSFSEEDKALIDTYVFGYNHRRMLYRAMTGHSHVMLADMGSREVPAVATKLIELLKAA